MDEYNFFADLLMTFRSLNDWIKAIAILSFTGLVLGGYYLSLYYWDRARLARDEHRAFKRLNAAERALKEIELSERLEALDIEELQLPYEAQQQKMDEK